MELLSLPIEIGYCIIDLLPVPASIKILKSSKTIYNDYCPLFQNKIDEYHQDQQELNEVIRPKYIFAIEREQQAVDMYINPAKYRIIPDVRKMVLLDDYLASLMDLNHITSINSQTPYTRSLFNKWWYRYLCLNGLYIDGFHYNIDNFISSLTGINPGTTITINDLWNSFREHITTDPNFQIDECISVEFCREEYDLTINSYRVLNNLYI